jgi:beta-xylosidase
MVISARSRMPWGPWENSPYNPIVHTASRDETWWSRGHGTLVDAVDGSWWILYHAYRKGFHTLGRHVLMEPIEWTADGWFRVPPDIRVDQPVRKPPGQALPHGLKLSDDFAGPQLGLQWRCLGGIEPGRVSVADGAMVMQGRGQAAADSNPLVCMPTDAAYEAQVELTLRGGQGGMVVYYNSEYFGGIGMGADGIFRMRRNRVMKPAAPWESRAVRLRIVNDRHEVRFFHSADGRDWDAGLHTIETSGYHHNTLGGFLGLRVGLYAAGDGTAEFRNFRYRTLAE